MRKILFLTLALIIFNSCSGMSDAGKVLRNEKVTNNDEFLIEKRKPLILPPDYNKLPEPGSVSQNKKKDSDSIKEILKAPKENNNQSNNSSSAEEKILQNIKK